MAVAMVAAAVAPVVVPAPAAAATAPTPLVATTRPYGAFNNSNQMVARWLEALGCRVEGSAVYADWKLARPR